MINIFKLVLISSLLIGCAQKRILGELPSLDSEFTLPIEKLEKKYPEIVTYKEPFGYCTSIDEFVSKLGSPSKIETQYFQVPLLVVPFSLNAGMGGAVGVLMMYGITPKQPRVYYWEKGNYTISARVLTEITCGYEDRVNMFNWNKKEVKLF